MSYLKTESNLFKNSPDGFPLLALLRLLKAFLTAFFALVFSFYIAAGQDSVTGALEGSVSNSATGQIIVGATLEITNEATGRRYKLVTNSKGIFFRGQLFPGWYLIKVTAPNLESKVLRQYVELGRTSEVIPVPVTLDPVGSATAGLTESEIDLRSRINTIDARHDQSSTRELESMPIGGETVTRTFDELALLTLGIAPPPLTIGSVAGPGVGAGVGSAGQFAANGLRSRANNFTVDGSDNNDEDIGVRRQGFLALIPQSLESVQEYQVISLLAPAQYGRNIGAQVNAVSKTGGNQILGNVYWAFNSDRLNSRGYFDSIQPNRSFPLLSAQGQRVERDGAPIMVSYNSGEENPFTYNQFGGTIGGPIVKNRTFYFLSFERQSIRGSREENFVVPTVEQRGIFGSGATGLFRNPFNGQNISSIPSSLEGAALFSLFPFPNNPSGIFGGNTLTYDLPVDADGTILSAKVDDSFRWLRRDHVVTGRYNFTDDSRTIPAVNQALFSTITADVRTHNFSFFANTQLSGPESQNPAFNQLRVSFGRTRLDFSKNASAVHLIPSGEFPNDNYLLNSPLNLNITTPPSSGIPNTGVVRFVGAFNPAGPPGQTTSEQLLGPIGQVNVAGFSQLGTDVYNFPQSRINDTYQFADEVTRRYGWHSFMFGLDTRFTRLLSDLPRLSRPYVSINGSPRLSRRGNGQCINGGVGDFCFPVPGPNAIIRPEDQVALGAPSNFLMTFNVDRPGAQIDIRFIQLNGFFQDTWRLTPALSLSYGIRYEYNSPVTEKDRLIEDTFDDPRLQLAPGISYFVAGRKGLYDPDLNNLAPRVGFAYSPKLFGLRRASVFRAGLGVFYDQILGAVASQSRNVFPSFLTVNFGAVRNGSQQGLSFLNPADFRFEGVDLRRPGTLNAINPAIPFDDFIGFLRIFFPNAITATLPESKLKVPSALHYAAAFEQQVGRRYTVLLSYVGTRGASLLRFNTPNLGQSLTTAPTALVTVDVPVGGVLSSFPVALGFLFNPGRAVADVGSITVFSSTASSRYDALQTEIHGYPFANLRFTARYTWSRAIDDVSDVFDLAGAFVLPQNSATLAGERAVANFDLPHRFTYQFAYSFPTTKSRVGWLTNDLELAGIGVLQSGPPYTINSLIDVNLDGNLTDRLDSTDGLEVTGNRSHPLRLVADPSVLLAAFGQDGRVGRNSFRAGNFFQIDLSVRKAMKIGSSRLQIRSEIFNLFNRANFGIPVRFLEASGFGSATDTIGTARRVQFSVKLEI